MSRAVAIVCAKNEAPRIAAVLRTLLPILPVVVVDDGSSDGTSAVADRLGTLVIRLEKNVGKGRAMAIGLSYVAREMPDAEVILFADADLRGFRSEHACSLLGPVLAGDYGMMVGMNDYGSAAKNAMDRRSVLISGQRAVRMDILRSMPRDAWDGYGVETWINHAAAASGWPVGTVIMPGVFIAYKWEKEGLTRGVRKMADMAAEVVRANVRVAQHPWNGSFSPGQFSVGAAAYASRGEMVRAGAASSPPNQEIQRAESPPSFDARGASTEEVMQALSEALVRAAHPYVKDHLWTEEARRDVGHAVGRKLAAPLWAVSSAACFFFFGPASGAMTMLMGMAATRTQ